MSEQQRRLRGVLEGFEQEYLYILAAF